MCRGGEVQRCRGLLEVLSAEMQKCRDAEMQRCRGAEMQRCRDAEVERWSLEV